MPGEPMPDLMVLIPGIGGPMLASDGKPIWAANRYVKRFFRKPALYSPCLE